MGTHRSVKAASMLLAALVLALVAPAAARAQSFEGVVNVSSTPGDSRQPHMALDDSGILHVAWADDSGRPGAYRALYARSFDLGRTFTPPAALSVGDGSALRPRLAVRGPAVYVVWTEDVSDTKDVIFRRSLDSGNSFEAPRNLSNTAGQSQEARIAVNAAGVVLVVWDEEDPSRHIELARSVDGGTNFARQSVAPIVRDLSDCPADSSPAACTAYPGVAVDPRRPTHVYITWHDTPGGMLNVFFTRSTDGGATYEAPRNLSNGVVHSHCAAIAVGPSGRIIVSYEDRKEPPPNQHKHDSVMVQSVDGGVSFTPPINISNSPTDALSDYPWPAEGPDGTIAISYEDNAFGGDLDAVVRLSRNGGTQYGDRLNISQNPSGTSTETVSLFGPDGTLYVLWQDHGDGPGESPPGEILLARAPGTSAPGNPPLQLTLQANGTAFRAGQFVHLSLTAANPGPAGVMDVYIGVFPPASAGPALGCPGGDPILLIPADLSRIVTSCASIVLRDIPAVAESFPIPGPFAPTGGPLLNFVWPANLPAGLYTFFIAVTPPGALGDGSLGPRDLVAAGTATVFYTP